MRGLQDVFCGSAKRLTLLGRDLAEPSAKRISLRDKKKVQSIDRHLPGFRSRLAFDSFCIFRGQLSEAIRDATSNAAKVDLTGASGLERLMNGLSKDSTLLRS